jgi:hypothetical protein
MKKPLKVMRRAGPVTGHMQCRRDKTPKHQHMHLFSHPAIGFRLAVCGRTSLPNSTKSQASKLLKVMKPNSSHDNMPKHTHMHMLCVHPALRPGNAHPYRTTSPRSAQESRSQTKNAKPCFPSTRFLRIVTSKPHCTRHRCQMATPSAQKQKATASSAPIGIRKGAGAPHAYKHARPSHRKPLTAKKVKK